MKFQLRGASGVALLASLACGLPAWGQVQTVQPAGGPDQITPPQAAEKSDSDRVIITGQLIAGASEDAPLPVEVFSMEDLKEQGSPTAKDFLRNLNISSEAFGNSDASIAGVAGGYANVNLRGLGAQRSMVLLNGHRFAPYDGGNGADINQIPSFAVGRIDVLKDGASVTYGSGAVGGVINYVTRKDVDGLEINYQHNFSANTSGEDTLEVLWGKKLDAGNFLFGFSYGHQSPLRVTERDWASNHTFQEVPGNFVMPNQNPTEYYTYNPTTGAATARINDYTASSCRAVGGEVASVVNPIYALQTNTRVGANDCATDWQNFYNLLEDEKYVRAYTEFNADLSDTMSLRIGINYAKTDVPRFQGTPTLPNGGKRATESAPSITALGIGSAGWAQVPYVSQLYDINGNPLSGAGSTAVNPFVQEFFNRAVATGAIGAGSVLTNQSTPSYLLLPSSWRPVWFGENNLYPENHKARFETNRREYFGGQIELNGDFVKDGFFGRFLPEDMRYNYSATYAMSYADLGRPDFVTSRLQNALRGYGGPNCQAVDRVPTKIVRIPQRGDYPNTTAGTTAFNAALAAANLNNIRAQYDATVGIQSDTKPGTNGCEYFNPFSSSFPTSQFNGANNPAYNPGNPNSLLPAGQTVTNASYRNSAAMMRWLQSNHMQEQEYDSLTFDATYSGTIPGFELPGGKIAWGAGVQWHQTASRLSIEGTLAEREEALARCTWGDQGYNQDFVGQAACVQASNAYWGSGNARMIPLKTDRGSVQYFGELQIPVLDNLNFSIAGRREQYTFITGDIWKIAGKYDLFPWLSFRGSYSTNFAAPPDSISNTAPVTSGTYFSSLQRTVPSTIITDPGITPEDDKSLNLGVIFAPEIFGGQLRASADFWEANIIGEIGTTTVGNPVFASVFGTTIPASTTAANCASPLIGYLNFKNGCTQGSTFGADLDSLNQYQLNQGGFIENGIDWKADYTFDIGPGSLSAGFDATQVLVYKVKGYSAPNPGGTGTTQYAGDFKGLGYANFTRSGTIMPRWRGNAFIRYSTEHHNVSLRYTYASGIKDESALIKISPGPNGVIEGATATVPAGCASREACSVIGSDDVFSTYGIDPHGRGQFDLNYIYQAQFMQDLELRFSVLNLFDEDPMAAQNTSGAASRVSYYNGYGDPRGRVIQVGLTKKF